jgi:hypothetical protein
MGIAISSLLRKRTAERSINPSLLADRKISLIIKYMCTKYYLSNCCNAQCEIVSIENETGICLACGEPCSLVLEEDN